MEEEIRDVTEFVIGIASNVLREGYRKNQRLAHIEDWPGESSLPDPRDREEELVSAVDHQIRLQALRHCLEELKPEDRALALDYYSADEEKQKDRQKLPSRLESP